MADHAGLDRTLKSLRGQWLDACRAHSPAREATAMANLNRNLEALHDLMGADMTETPTQPNPQPDPGQPNPNPQQ